ncbi:MAG TPA: PH domain-containing protein [Jatrophihabitans sp.]|jgi:uncharacterized membrane protein YdbT with pleckstrin-like domain
MGFPEKLLADDEKVVEHLHPHWITLVPATIWFIVVCAAAGFGIGYAPSDGTTHKVFVIAVIVIAVILLWWLTVTPLLSWKTTHFVITDRRVLIRRGVLNHTGKDISLQRLTDVGFRQSFWDRIVNAGTLTLESAGEHGTEVLEDVPRSEQQQQLLNRLIEEDGTRRARETAAHYQAPPQEPGTAGGPLPPTTSYPDAGTTQQYPPQ